MGTVEASVHTPRDVVADDGTAIRRGYLEVILEGQDAESPSKGNTTVTVALLDQKNRRESMIDFREFKSQIPIALDREKRRSVIGTLMNRLTNHLQVSVFTDDLEDFDAQLERFGHYLEEASIDAILASAK